MDMGLIVANIIIAGSGVILVFFVIRNMVLRVKQIVGEEGHRIASIKEHLAKEEVEVIQVAKKAAQDCHFADTLEKDHGEVHVFYQVDYVYEGIKSSGWAILRLKPATRATSEGTKEWLWRLS